MSRHLVHPPAPPPVAAFLHTLKAMLRAVFATDPVLGASGE